MASSGLNTTPLEDGSLDNELNFDDLESYPPLFPQNSFDEYTTMPAVPSTQTTGFASVNSGMQRQKSSPGRPPSQPLHARKRSDTCGIAKAPRPRKNLPEIQVDSEDDKETAKRKKNTAAARKSRQRKADVTEGQSSEIARLRALVYRLGGNPDEEQS